MALEQLCDPLVCGSRVVLRHPVNLLDHTPELPHPVLDPYQEGRSQETLSVDCRLQ